MKEKLNCVLLIDDDAATNVYNSAIVKAADITDRIEVRESGQKALDFLSSMEDGAHPSPALIFLDVNMPGMDGWEFLEEYHKLAEEQKAKVVVFMLTTSLDPNDEVKSTELGAHGFIRKPLTPELVQEIAKEHFPEKFG